MSFRCPLAFSSSCTSFAYLALETSSALYSLYIPHLSLNMYYIRSTQTVDKFRIDFQYHKRKSFIWIFPCFINNLMGELFLILTLILYFNLVCLIINNSYSYAVNPCLSKLNTYQDVYVSEHFAKRTIILSREYLFYSLVSLSYDEGHVIVSHIFLCAYMYHIIIMIFPSFIITNPEILI